MGRRTGQFAERRESLRLQELLFQQFYTALQFLNVLRFCHFINVPDMLVDTLARVSGHSACSIQTKPLDRVRTAPLLRPFSVD